MKMVNFYKGGLFLTLSAIMAGCASVALNPGAENVMITNSTIPTSCYFVGTVSNRDVNGVTTSYTSHENIEVMQLNILKNKTQKLGGNALVLIEHQTISRHVRTGYMLDTHVMAGNAYHCDRNDLSKLEPQNMASISDAQNSQ